jgi:hypothetical protein
MNLENTTDEFSKELFSEECPFEFPLAVHELKMSKPLIYFGKNKYLNIYFLSFGLISLFKVHWLETI